MPSLIDALTGAPGEAFLPHSSEVVSPDAGVQSLLTNRLLSGHLTTAHVFITAFLHSENLSQTPNKVNPSVEKVTEKCQ